MGRISILSGSHWLMSYTYTFLALIPKSVFLSYLLHKLSSLVLVSKGIMWKDYDKEAKTLRRNKLC